MDGSVVFDYVKAKTQIPMKYSELKSFKKIPESKFGSFKSTCISTFFTSVSFTAIVLSLYKKNGLLMVLLKNHNC